MEKTLKLYTYIDGINDTPFPNEIEQIKTSAFTVNLKRMGAVPSITCTVQHKECLDDFWTGKEYVIFNEEKYFIKQTPTSSFSNSDARYKHELELVSERIILDNVYFYDAVINGAESNKPVSNSTKFAFFGTIFEFAERLNQSLVYSKLQTLDENGEYLNGYRVVVDDDVLDVGGKKVEAENQFFSNIIQESYNTYEIPYYFVGKTIHIGYTNNVILETFKYGRNDSLLSIKKQNANYKVVNRATGYGSDANLTYYYPNDTPKGDVAVLLNGNETTEVFFKDPEKVSGFSLLDSYKYSYQEYKKNVLQVTFEPQRYSRLSSESYKVYQTTPLFIRSYDFVVDGFFEVEDYVLTKILLSKPNETLLRDFEFKVSSQPNKFPHNSIFTITEVNVMMSEESTNDSDKSVFSDVKVNDNWENGTYTSKEFYLAPNTKYVIQIKGVVTDFLEEYSKDTFKNETTRNVAYNAIMSATSIIQEQKEKYYWLLVGTESKYELDSLGLGMTKTVAIGDVITFKQLRYITPSDKLMPPIYRESLGAERFYNAYNDTYINKETDDYFYFQNEYIDGRPKEHIVDFPDIKPTIKEMTNSQGFRIDMFSEFAYDLYDNDEVDEEGNYKHPYFFAKLRKTDGPHGFNLFDQALESGEMTISMTSGYCGGCSFIIGVDSETMKNTVQVTAYGNLLRDQEGNVVVKGNAQDSQNDTQNNEVWLALKKDKDTYSTLLPSAQYPSSRLTTSDTFVILNIRMPKSYLTAAEEKLEQEILSYMEENNVEKFNFSITFSRIYLAQHPDVLALLNDRALLTIEYNGKEYSLYVSSYTYRMTEKDILPEITVELNETLSVSKNALQNSVDSVKEEILSGVTGAEFYKVAVKYFMQKTVTDRATAKQEFSRGVDVLNGLHSDSIDAEEIHATNIDASEIVKTKVLSAKTAKAEKVDANTVHTTVSIVSDDLVQGERIVGDNAELTQANITNAEIQESHTEQANIDNADITTADIDDLTSAFTEVTDTLISSKTRIAEEITSVNFAGGLTGYGFKIDSTGKAQMRSLELFESLIVPELRYNRVTVITGEQWQSAGGGIIESVDPIKRTFMVRLEDGDIPTVDINDLCKGIFHFDKNSGTQGFQTSYFKIVGVGQGNTSVVNGSTISIVGSVSDKKLKVNGSVKEGVLSSNGFIIRYELRDGCKVHPQPNMSFVAFGNTTNKDRQQSIYSTLRYKRYLVGVDTWEIQERNIAMQLGDLTDLEIGGQSFKGYSAYLTNIYMTGVIKQLSGDGNTYSVPVDRGAWQSGQRYYYYDRVSHNGSLWLCVVESTISPPNEQTSQWIKEVSKGDKGEDGTSIKVSGTLNSESELPIPPTNASDCYIIGSDLYVWDGAKWNNVGQFKGEDGKDGEDGIGVSSVTELYYLSSSNSVAPNKNEYGQTTYPQWQNGQYLWTRTRTTYTNGNSTYTDWKCVTGAAGATGKTGKILRVRGVYANNETYVNNDEFQDIVIYNSSYYTPKGVQTIGIAPTNSNVWLPFNEFQNVATSVLLAQQGYIDVLGAGRLFVGQTANADGWLMTEGAIRHTKTGLSLDKDGKLIAPNGAFEITTTQGELDNALSSIKMATDALSLKVESVVSPIGDNLLPNTDFSFVDVTKGTNFTPFDKWEIYGSASSVLEDSDHLGKNLIYINSTGGFHGVRCTSPNFFSLSAGEDFTISVYGKASSTSNAIFVAVKYLDVNLSEISSERIAFGFYPSNEWQRASQTLTRSSHQNAKYICVDIYSNSAGSHWISMPKLERGTAVSEWTPNLNDYNNKKLLATGIDIENKIVTVTADTFKVQDNYGNEMAVFENIQNEDGTLTPMLKTDLIRVTKLDAATGTFSGFIRHTPMIVDLATTDGRAKAHEVFTYVVGYDFNYIFPNFDKIGQYLILRNFKKNNVRLWLNEHEGQNISNAQDIPNLAYFYLPFKSADGLYSNNFLIDDVKDYNSVCQRIGYSTPTEMKIEAQSLIGESLRIILEYDDNVSRDLTLQVASLFFNSNPSAGYGFAFKYKPNSLVDSSSAVEIDGSYYDYEVSTPAPSNNQANVPYEYKNKVMPYISLECKSEVSMVPLGSQEYPCNHIFWDVEIGYDMVDEF